MLAFQLRDRISDADIGWLAGIIDGEGTITISPRKRTDRKCRIYGWQMRVKVSNNDPRIITKVADLMQQINGHKGHMREKRMNRCRKHYYWEVAALKALAFLKFIKPFLVSKQQQAKIAIEFQERMSASIGLVHRTLTSEEVEVRQKLHQQIKFLNRKIPQKYDELGLG
jgi:hypothetical protein